MKTIKLILPGKQIMIAVIALMILITAESCARKVTFMTSTVVPAARGTVKVKKDDNKNYSLSIQLVNLSEPKRLLPAKQTYIVWMESDGQPIKNLGQINSSTSLFSSTLKASFETVTAFKPRKIFITAEDDSEIRYPGSQTVLSTDYF
ncbi:MAG: hypothetical protein ABIN94_07615 [Ferruginibacter sp.]